MGTIGILFLGRKRPGFDAAWGAHIVERVKQSLPQLGCETALCPWHAVDDASLHRALAWFRGEQVDVLVLLQPTMSDGRLAAVLAQQWDAPVVLWATPENPDSDRVSSCSLVGTHVFAANLRQLGRRAELVYGMPGEEATEHDLTEACRVVRAVTRLSRAKVGLVGYHAPGFIDMHADPSALLAALGVQLYHTGVQELVDRMDAVETAAAEADADAVGAMGLECDGVTRADLVAAARSYLALRTMVREEGLDALALRDWPELPNLTGHWPYLSIARLLDEGLPVACEGDVDGAVLSLMGEGLGLGAGYLTDWLEHDASTITLWHGGCAPLSMCEAAGKPRGPRLGVHFNSGKPVVINARLRAGEPATLARLWRCDGVYRMMAEDVHTIEPRRALLGTAGAVDVPGRDVREWFRTLCQAGMPHHLVVFQGHNAAALRRAAGLLGIAWIS